MTIKIAIYEKPNTLCVVEVIDKVLNEEKTIYKTRLMSNSGFNWDMPLYEKNLISEYLEYELRSPTKNELIKISKYTTHDLLDFKTNQPGLETSLFQKYSAIKKIDISSKGTEINTDIFKHDFKRNTKAESYKKNNEGYIYILSNESFSNNLIKIGQSKDRYRQDELYTTGVPTKFRVEYYALVNNYVDIERRVHSLLRQYRPNKNREFFNCSIPQAINVIRQNSEVHKEYVYYKSPEEIEAEREKQEKLKKERDKKREEEKIKRDLKIKQDNIFREEQQKRNKEQFAGIMFLTGVILSFITLFFYQNFWLFLLTMACFIVWMFMNE